MVSNDTSGSGNAGICHEAPVDGAGDFGVVLVQQNRNRSDSFAAEGSYWCLLSC